MSDISTTSTTSKPAAAKTPAKSAGKKAGAKAGAKTNAKPAAKSAAKTSAAKPASQPREGSGMAGALVVLKAKRQPMTVRDIYEAMVAKKLAGSLKGKTPIATLSAQLATANKKGQWVERPEAGKYVPRKD